MLTNVVNAITFKFLKQNLWSIWQKSLHRSTCFTSLQLQEKHLLHYIWDNMNKIMRLLETYNKSILFLNVVFGFCGVQGVFLYFISIANSEN